MAEPDPAAGSAVDLWRRALEANARYYESWAQLTSTWLREVADLGAAVSLPRVARVSSGPFTWTPRADPARRPQPSPRSGAAPGGGPGPVLVLEGEPGAEAVGAFLVENSAPTPVQGRVEVEPFLDPAGVPVSVGLSLQPATVQLDAGESAVIQVRGEIPGIIAPGAELRSTVRVHGVPGTTIPILVRRT